MFQARIKTEFCHIFVAIEKNFIYLRLHKRTNESRLAAYRVGDSPIDDFTPLIVYLRPLQSWRSDIK
jgi:hypothetical protein